jgi:hypothetical protein
MGKRDQSMQKETASRTYVCGLSSIFNTGEPSLILSLRTGFFLINSRMTSCTNAIGALVLMDPAAAWERETLYPALRRAELDGRERRKPGGQRRTYTYSVRDGQLDRKKLATFDGVK